MKYHCLYQIVNKINGMIYIGIHSTNDLFDSYMGSGKEIKKAFKEFKRENFIKYIIGIYNTKYEMIQAEMKIVNKEFVLREDTYNIHTGGNINPNKRYVSEETKRKIAEANKGRYVSEETNEKRSKSLKAYYESVRNGDIIHPKMSEESIQKMITTMTGRKLSEEHKKNISEGLKGRITSEETKIKQSISNKGLKRSEETKQNISIASKNRPPISEETRRKMKDAQQKRRIKEKAP